MVTRDKIQIGEISAEGNFNILLDKEYLSTTKKQAQKARENAPSGWEISFKTVGTTFECFGGELEYENPEAILVGIPDPEISYKDNENKNYVLYAVSQPEIAEWLHSYGQENIVKGYYLRWFFLETAASAKGECLIPSYTGNGDENYKNSTLTNLELQKGWNIVKYTITEIFTDLNGKVVPSKTEISSIKTLPEDIKWIKLKI